MTRSLLLGPSPAMPTITTHMFISPVSMCTQPYLNSTLTLLSLGTITDGDQSLAEQIKRLEQMFTVETPKLKEITDHFVNELTRGMYSPMQLRDHLR